MVPIKSLRSKGKNLNERSKGNEGDRYKASTGGQLKYVRERERISVTICISYLAISSMLLNG